MPTRVSESTLEQFREATAGRQPTPAGVAVAAISAGFALGLLVKVLTISRSRAVPEETPRLEALTAAAQATSQSMLQLADDDIAAFEAYLAAKRRPQSTEAERQARQQHIHSSVDRAIDVPLAAAHEAAAGLQLCSEASAATPPALVADLGVAATLLASSLRSFLLCAESNVRQLAPDVASHRERLATETRRHEQTLYRTQALLESLKP